MHDAESLHADLLEIEVSVEAAEECHESEQEFGQRRVHVDIVAGMEVLSSELAEMDLIETMDLKG